MPSRAATVFTGAVMSAALLVGQGLNLWFADALKDLPSVENVRLELSQSIRILDRHGDELYRVTQDQDRTSLETKQIPPLFLAALVGIEDERFFTRAGCIDAEGIARAAWRNLLSGEPSEGGSTITQQLVRSLYLAPEKTLKRKVREITIACELEHALSRTEIVTLYVNRVSFGNHAYGLEQAAETYFHVPASSLSLAQIAALAAIPQRPSYFDPFGPHLRTAVASEALDRLRSGTETVAGLLPTETTIGLLPRRVRTASGDVVIDGRSSFVLKAMQRSGAITSAQANAATSELEHLSFAAPGPTRIRAPHFVFWIRDQLDQLMDSGNRRAEWSAAGLRVTTTLDPVLQKLAEDTVANALPTLQQTYHARNVALVALDRSTREVLAYVGNTDYFDQEAEGQIDMARAPRQPGSSFKPLVYATLFANTNQTPTSFIADLPLKIGSAKPKNYEGGFAGWMTIRQALVASRNIPAIRAYFMAGGEDPILTLAAAAGASTPLKQKVHQQETNPSFAYGWPLAIGAAETPLVEMTDAYATIANGGQAQDVVSIRQIKDNAGKQRLGFVSAPPVQAIPYAAAVAVDSILRDKYARPEGGWRDVLTLPGTRNAAKTGTSNLCLQRSLWGTCLEYGVNNVWTLGYTDELVVGVWIGNADNSPLTPDADGLNAAAPVWHYFMKEAQSRWQGCETEGCVMAGDVRSRA